MIIKQSVYDGKLIHERFAYKYFRKNVSPYGNIVAFKAPMYVSDALIDLEDSLSDDFIHSQNAINFCWEIPKPIIVDGDDLLVQDEFVGTDEKIRKSGKVSVSITYSNDNIAVGHTGINILAGDKAPAFAYSSNLTEAASDEFMKAVIDYFNNEVQDQFIATTKVIV